MIQSKKQEIKEQVLFNLIKNSSNRIKDSIIS